MNLRTPALAPGAHPQTLNLALRPFPGSAMLPAMSTTPRRRYRPVAGPLKVHGGKGAHGAKLARWIVSLMPRHRRYVEAFAGGLAVLRARDPADRRLWLADNGDDRGVAEVVNDLDGTLANFWRVMGDPAGRTGRPLRRISAGRQQESDWAGDHIAPGPIGNSVHPSTARPSARVGTLTHQLPPSRPRTSRSRDIRFWFP
jgi:hypothetical protein